MHRFVYADNAATTPVSREVLDAMLPCFESDWGNPSSQHSKGMEAKDILDDARERIAAVLGCTAGEIYFTSCGTESDNWIIRSVCRAKKNRGKHIISTEIEHNAVRRTLEQLQEDGFEVTYLKPDSFGQISPGQLEAAIRPDTILITIMMANNVIGTVLNIKPLLWGDPTGHIVALQKCRGRKKAIEAIVELYRTRAIEPEKQRIAISHADCLEEAQQLAERIRAVAEPKELIICPHEPVTGSHVGPGMLALFFFGEGR